MTLADTHRNFLPRSKVTSNYFPMTSKRHGSYLTQIEQPLCTCSSMCLKLRR